jgi:hypothetical protein
MDTRELRPLGVGEVLDFAIKICRARYLTLMKLVAIVVIPTQVISAIIRASTSNNSTVTTTVNGQVHLTSAAWTTLAGSLVAVIISGIASQLASASCLKSLSGAYLEGEATWQDSLRFALSRVGSIVWLAFLSSLLAGLALFLFVIPGVYFWGSWLVALPVLLIENTRGRAALRRSRQLVKGRWWPVVVTYLLAGLLVGIVSVVFGAVLGAVVGVSHASEGVRILVDAIAGILSGVLTTPFIAAVIVVLYFDLRVRKEGFDLQMLAHHLGGTPRRSEEPAWPPPLSTD